MHFVSQNKSSILSKRVNLQIGAKIKKISVLVFSQILKNSQKEINCG